MRLYLKLKETLRCGHSWTVDI